MKKYFLPIVILLSGFFINKTIFAEELSGSFILSNGGDSGALTDDSHYTTVPFNSTDTITISSAEVAPISGIYITWDSPAAPWTLTTDNGNVSCGSNGFLHEYVALDKPSSKVIINIPNGGIRISGIRIFSEGELPHDVQVWNTPCTKADIMVIASHADDEILFFGGILPMYSYVHDADIQVVYMSQFWDGQKIREHEKLDGLWEAGIRFYPVCGNFGDYYSENIDTAEKQYDYNLMVSYITSQIRRFKPQVVITHDVNGEYGHGFHMLTSKAAVASVTASADSTQYPDSATLYGVWDTPKTYIHCYKENPIKLDLRVPITEDYAGRTALDIATDAYKKHVSQQWCWFYVSDENKYSCADFGLYRSLVGADTTNDILCNIKTYKVQAAEEEAQRLAEEQSRQAYEASKEAARLEAESLEKASREKASVEAESIRLNEERLKNQKHLTTFTIIGIAIVAIIIGAVIFTIKKRKKAVAD